MRELIIRRAISSEASDIAPLLLSAMEEIVYEFIGVTKTEQALDFLKYMISKPANQYSYENCWVAEFDNKIIAAACIYDGAQLLTLRKPVANQINKQFTRVFHPENETQAGEFYIDAVGVDPKYRGKGIGTKIFRFLIEEYALRHKKVLGLLVDIDNPAAKKLYLNLGFQIMGQKTLAGKRMEHLQYTG